MVNRLVCLEGTVDYEEEIRNQAVNIISFHQGQQITINRDRMLPGRSFAEQISLQLDNAQKIFKQFNFVKMEEWKDDDVFGETIEIIFTFVSASGQRVWQVTLASCIAGQDIINFTSVYPDKGSMEREIVRLHRCVKRFILNT